jgi:hypothetical protein
MGKRKVYGEVWYTMPKDWRHQTNGGPADMTIGIKDEHYGSPVYRTRVDWQQLDGEGVFTMILVLPSNGRTDREVAEDAVASARKVWEVKRHIAVAQSQGNNGQCDLFLSFRLPSMPPIGEVEQTYRLIKGL